jgi:hypothetical protein
VRRAGVKAVGEPGVASGDLLSYVLTLEQHARLDAAY